MSGQGQFSSVQVRSKSYHVKIRSSHVKLGQDRSSQIRLGQDKVRESQSAKVMIWPKLGKDRC